MQCSTMMVTTSHTPCEINEVVMTMEIGTDARALLMGPPHPHVIHPHVIPSSRDPSDIWRFSSHLQRLQQLASPIRHLPRSRSTLAIEGWNRVWYSALVIAGVPHSCYLLP